MLTHGFACGSEPDTLLALTAFNLAVGNTDAHAKNIEILRPTLGPAKLALAYDIAMHGHHPVANPRFAMQINGQDEVTAITGTDLVAEGMNWKLPRQRALKADRIFALMFEIIGLASAARAPYVDIAAGLIDSWTQWLAPRTTGSTAAVRRRHALTTIAQLDGLLLVRLIAGPAAGDQAAKGLGVRLPGL